MTFVEGIAADLSLLEGVETVTLQRFDVGATLLSSDASVTAFFSMTTAAPIAASQGTRTISYTARCHIQVNTAANAPRRNDRIVSVTKGTWEILQVDIAALATRFVCHCRKVS